LSEDGDSEAGPQHLVSEQQELVWQLQSQQQLQQQQHWQFCFGLSVIFCLLFVV
jgi:hypothetical protein